MTEELLLGYPRFPYSGNLTWLPERVIFLTNHGSHAYGMNTPESDLDIKGVAIPPKEYYLSISKRFEQAESKEPDMVVYELQKFCKLAADANPSILEVLFTDESDHRILTSLGKKLLDNRDLFLSKKARFTYTGYAFSQMKRINLHYRWLKNPPSHKPTRKEFGLPEETLIPADQLAAAQSAVEKRLATWNFEDLSDIGPDARIAVQNNLTKIVAEMQTSMDEVWKGAARSVGMDDNLIYIMGKEREYKARKAEWDSYENWKKTRNPKRAELEAKYGFDCKHASHIVRLVVSCEELLKTGKLQVKRPDKDLLLSIRQGAWTYDQLKEWLEKKEKEVEEIYKTSPLPHSANREKIDALVIELIEEFNF